MPSKKGLPQQKSGVSELYSESKSVYNREYVKEKYFMPHVQIPKEYEEAIRNTAKSKGMSLSEFVRWCVLQHID